MNAILKWFFLTIVLFAGSFAFYFFYKISVDLDKVNFASARYLKQGHTEIEFFDRFEKKIHFWQDRNSQYIDLNDMPKHLPKAFIAIEDERFLNHIGIDIQSILRSLFINLKFKYSKQGASTITQQLARILYLDRSRSLYRKFKEILVALALEIKFSKNELLELYLNQIYLGVFWPGVDAASRFYFSKSVRNLSLEESALLAGLAKAPAHYSPFIDSRKAFLRRRIVLKKMLDLGYISTRAYKSANIAPLPRFKSEKHIGFFHRKVLEKELFKSIGFSAYSQSHLKVKTTQDKKIGEMVASKLKIAPQGVYTQYQPLQTAAIVFIPKTGQILGIQGSRDPRSSQFDRTRNMRRKAPPMLEPLGALLAIKSGYQLDDAVFKDLNAPKGKTSKEFRGGASVYHTLTSDFHMDLFYLHSYLGEKPLSRFAYKSGFKGFSSIGFFDYKSVKINLIELAGFYGALFNFGHKTEFYSLERVSSIEKGLLWQRSGAGSGLALSDQASAYIVNFALQEGLKAKGHLALNKIISDDNISGKFFYEAGGRNFWAVIGHDRLALALWIGAEMGKQSIAFLDREGCSAMLDFLGGLWAHLPQVGGNKARTPSGIIFKRKSLSHSNGLKSKKTLPFRF